MWNILSFFQGKRAPQIENKFLVLKNSLIKEKLSKSDYTRFGNLVNKILENEPEHSYYVVNVDEPYADKIKEMILKGEARKEK